MPRPARILVIDDEPGIVKLVSYALSGEGFQVVSAARMEAALLEFDKLAYDLVITDIFMAGMGGIEGIKTLRRAQPSIKILAISGGHSGMAPDEVLKAASKLGADAVLAKPFELEHLVRTVRRLLAVELKGRST